MPSRVNSTFLAYEKDANGSNVSAYHWEAPEAEERLDMGGRPSPRRSKSKHRKHESKKSTSSSTSKSKSPHRTTPLTLPRSLSNDERKHGAQLESLLHSERLRADDAVSRAEYAERREKEALAAVQRLEETKLKLQEELWAVESASRDYQVQLELTERELRVSQRDGELLQHETKLLDRTCRETQEKCRQYQASFRKYEERMSTQETEMQNSMQKWFISGEGQGYEVGYSEGYREGRVDGKQHGIRLGRKEGLREGRESGRTEERRNAMEAMDRFLAQQSHGGSDAAGIRRWAQSVYYPESQRATSSVGSNPVAP